MDVQSEILQQMRALKKRIAHLERLENLLLLDEDDMASNSATAPPSQQSVVEYIANQISSVTNQISPVKIVAVEYAEFTGTQTNSTASGANFAITDLSIEHAMAKSTNKLLLLGMVGVIADGNGYASPGVAFAADGTIFPIGDAAGNRGRVTAAANDPSTAIGVHGTRFIQAEYAPATTASKTYTLRAINVLGSTETVYINRTQSDSNHTWRPRAVSNLRIIEYED